MFTMEGRRRKRERVVSCGLPFRAEDDSREYSLYQLNKALSENGRSRLPSLHNKANACNSASALRAKPAPISDASVRACGMKYDPNVLTSMKKEDVKALATSNGIDTKGMSKIDMCVSLAGRNVVLPSQPSYGMQSAPMQYAPLQLEGPSAPLQLEGPSAPFQLEGPSAPLQLEGPNAPLQLEYQPENAAAFGKRNKCRRSLVNHHFRQRNQRTGRFCKSKRSKRMSR